MRRLRRKLFSQNFLHSRKLVNKLVRGSSIGKNDLVLETGPGKGIITEELSRQSQHVIAVELDNHWYKYLQKKFKDQENLTLYQNDILNFNLPALPYKVFANIPFAIEGKIIRYLIDSKNPPYDCYLAMMSKLASRLAAPHKENQFSIQHKPWFDFSIYHRFKRTDFVPVPSVEAVIFRFSKRSQPLLSVDEKRRYQEFIELGFGQGMPVFKNLRRRYGEQRALRLLLELGISKKARPANLSLNQWINLYKKFR